MEGHIPDVDYLCRVRLKGARAFMFYTLVVLELATENISFLFLKRETSKMTERISIKKLSLGHFNFLITNFLYFNM